MTKSEMFVITVVNANAAVENTYIGIDSKGSLKKEENPIKITRCFSHDDAHEVKNLLKQKEGFLAEGESLRVKALTQCVRDYCGSLLRKGFDSVIIAGDETVDVLRKRYEVKKKAETKEKKVEKVEEAATEAATETPVEEKAE